MSDTASKAFWENAIAKALEDAIQAEVAVCVEEAQERLAKRIPEIISGLALNVRRHISLEYGNQQLLIHIKLDGNL